MSAALIALASCAKPAPDAPVAPPSPQARSPTPPDPLGRAQAAADELGRTMRGRLQAAMVEGGPARAVEVCSSEAPTIAAEIAGRTKVRVGRASLRMRGASTAPDWVASWLREQGERPAEGVVGFARVEGSHARVLRPIPIEAPCLTCHGQELAPEIAKLLDARYPQDQARGYALGALRGALWAEVDLPANAP